MVLYIGNHTSSSKGYAAMGRQMLKNGGNTFAFFTRNPRGGKAKEIDPADVERFLKLSGEEKAKNLALAKAVPFSKTNEQLKEYEFSSTQERPGSLWQLLMAMREARLKNDALNETFYELVGEHYQSVGKDYAVFLFHGTYDVPLKASDKESLWESEEVYDFLVCTISPLEGEYEPGEPEWGFLFPAFSDRSTEIHRIDIFQKNATASQTELMKKLFP